jgi:hypothetical protein
MEGFLFLYGQWVAILQSQPQGLWQVSDRKGGTPAISRLQTLRRLGILI